MSYHRIFHMSNTVGAANGIGTVFPSEVPGVHCFPFRGTWDSLRGSC